MYPESVGDSAGWPTPREMAGSGISSDVSGQALAQPNLAQSEGAHRDTNQSTQIPRYHISFLVLFPDFLLRRLAQGRAPARPLFGPASSASRRLSRRPRAIRWVHLWIQKACLTRHSGSIAARSPAGTVVYDGNAALLGYSFVYRVLGIYLLNTIQPCRPSTGTTTPTGTTTGGRPGTRTTTPTRRPHGGKAPAAQNHGASRGPSLWRRASLPRSCPPRPRARQERQPDRHPRWRQTLSTQPPQCALAGYPSCRT